MNDPAILADAIELILALGCMPCTMSLFKGPYTLAIVSGDETQRTNLLAHRIDAFITEHRCNGLIGEGHLVILKDGDAYHRILDEMTVEISLISQFLLKFFLGGLIAHGDDGAADGSIPLPKWRHQHIEIAMLAAPGFYPMPATDMFPAKGSIEPGLDESSEKKVANALGDMAPDNLVGTPIFARKGLVIGEGITIIEADDINALAHLIEDRLDQPKVFSFP